MYNLLLPVNGKSTRFPNLRPKWLLTHPSGNCMLLSGLLGLNINEAIQDIYIITNKADVEKYDFIDGITRQFQDVLKKTPIFVILDGETDSQVSTIQLAIQRKNIRGPIAIKDCDNFFSASLNAISNTIYAARLEDVQLINPINKCYIGFYSDIDQYYTAEKEIISNMFGCGLYTFKDTSVFIKYGKYAKSISEIYNCIEFDTTPVRGYVDWGTLEDWQRYCDSWTVFFVDIDGVLVHNSCEYMTPKWGDTQAIIPNVKILNSLYEGGYSQIILTTSRREQFKEITEKQLLKIGLKYHKIIYGLLSSCKRTLINDYSQSNTYPTALAINIARNCDNLKDMI